MLRPARAAKVRGSWVVLLPACRERGEREPRRMSGTAGGRAEAPEGCGSRGSAARGGATEGTGARPNRCLGRRASGRPCALLCPAARAGGARGGPAPSGPAPPPRPGLRAPSGRQPCTQVPAPSGRSGPGCLPACRRLGRALSAAALLWLQVSLRLSRLARCVGGLRRAQGFNFPPLPSGNKV